MKIESKIRWIEEQDIEIINNWWDDWGEKPPLLELLPEDGYGGLVVERDGKIVAAMYVYLTNSKMGYMDFLISDRKWKNKDRWDLIMDLGLACYNVLIKAGCTEVWGMSLVEGVVERLQAIGATISEDPHFKMSIPKLEPGKFKIHEGYSIYKNEIK